VNKLVIFDCDGVLVDSEIISNRIDAEALTSIGYPITTEESIKRFTGVNAKTVRETIFAESGKDIPLDFLDAQQPLVLKAFETELNPLMEVVLEMIDRQNIMRCVASSSPKHRVIHSLKLTGQCKFFNDKSIFTSQQVSKGKPAPDLFLLVASEMGYSPEDCIVIEDSPAGIQAGLSAKMNVIGFLGGSHAQYDWYRQKIVQFGIPIAHSNQDLLAILKTLLKMENDRNKPPLCLGASLW
jgi:HAD superfamily hydrolase (TIGR01509 family)